MESSDQISRRIRRNDFVSIRNEIDFRETPLKPEDSELKTWVQALRNGDNQYRDRIIKSHMRLALAIAKQFSTPARRDDLSGEALLALTQAVEWSGPHLDADGSPQPSRLHDNEITPYIVSTIRRFLRDFIETDRPIHIPGRTFRKKAAEGKIDQEGHNTDHILAPVIRSTYNDDVYDRDQNGRMRLQFPCARREQPSYEFKEALDLATKSNQEREIIGYRSRGYKYEEIAELMGLSKSCVGRINAVVEERFERLYA